MSSYELFEDSAGEWRWRLVSSGEIIADSGEGYSSKSAARDAIERVQDGAPGAAIPSYDEPHFQVFEDSAGEWRWRLVAANGRIIADSGEGYVSRSDARRAAENVRDRADDADVKEV